MPLGFIDSSIWKRWSPSRPQRAALPPLAVMPPRPPAIAVSGGAGPAPAASPLLALLADAKPHSPLPIAAAGAAKRDLMSRFFRHYDAGKCDSPERPNVTASARTSTLAAAVPHSGGEASSERGDGASARAGAADPALGTSAVEDASVGGEGRRRAEGQEWGGQACGEGPGQSGGSRRGEESGGERASGSLARPRRRRQRQRGGKGSKAAKG